MRPPGFGRRLGELGQLAGPLAFVHLNSHLTGTIDTALAGRVDAVTMGATGLGAAVFIVVSVLGMTAGLGADPLTAQAFGAGRPAAARRTLWQGIWVALAIAAPLAVGVWIAGGYLEALGVTPEVAEGARRYLWGRLPAVPAWCVVMVLRSYLQAAQRSRAMVVSAVLMNVLNAALVWVLLHGDLGLTRLGLPAVGLPALGVF
ncbi:MAG TPA: MATE family efflux transporter, partial [Myxococcota bacterium]|nr:MATE family efflux transporter [Myxococcota bacterium]